MRPEAAGAGQVGETGARAPIVKVCGITRSRDAMAAVACGAGALGFVFWPDSPRAVSVAAARSIARDLPPFTATVGVFVNQPAALMLDVAAAVPLTVVQFHGDEPEEAVASFPWRVMRAVALGAPDGAARLARLPPAITVLLDAHDARLRGGTGRAIDWPAAAAVAARRRVVLAGGLRPDNLRDALRIVRPWGLDVSSGVESAPGIKDPDRLRAFFDAVADADRQDADEPGAAPRRASPSPMVDDHA